VVSLAKRKGIKYVKKMLKKKNLSEWYHSSLFFRKENAGEKKEITP